MAADRREKGRRQVEEKRNGNGGGWKRKKFLGGREREWRWVGDRRNGGGWKRKGMTIAAGGKEKRFWEGGEGKEITAG